MIRPPPISTLFPYTTLFRSGPLQIEAVPVFAQVSRGQLQGAQAVWVWSPFREPRRLTVEELKRGDRKSTRLNSSHANISYAVFCLKKKKLKTNNNADKTTSP